MVSFSILNGAAEVYLYDVLR